MATVTITHVTAANGQEAGWVPVGTANDGDAVTAAADGKYVTGSTLTLFDDITNPALYPLYTDPGALSLPSDAIINAVTVNVIHSLNGASTLADTAVGMNLLSGGTILNPPNNITYAFDRSIFPTSNGGSYSQITAASFTDTHTFVTNPVTGVAWTRADIFNSAFKINLTADAAGGLAAATDYQIDQISLTVTYNLTAWQLDWSIYGLTSDPPFQLYTFGSLPTAFTLDFDFFYAGIFFPSGTSINWVAATVSPQDTGWFMSRNVKFAGAADIVNNSRPKNVRTFSELSSFSAGTPLGGSPGCACVTNNELVYAAGGYTLGTDQPSIRIFNGTFDRPVASVPKTTASAVPFAIVSLLSANGTVYFSSYDTGSTSANYVGRVFSLAIETGIITPLGSAFAAGEIPYALCWHAGRLWCGTNKGDATGGSVYYFRPGIDTSWTSEHDTTTDGQGGVASLCSYKGLLYVGCTAASGTFAKVLVRGSDNTYTTSDTGTGGAAKKNNGFIALAVFGSNLYASFWNPDSPVVSKIRKFNGSAWSTAYTGAAATNVPYLGFPQDGTTMLAIGGSPSYAPALLSTTDGASWTDRSAFLPSGISDTIVPAFGVVVR